MPARAWRGEFATQAKLEGFENRGDFAPDFLRTLLVIQLAFGVFRVPHQHTRTILQLRCQSSASASTSQLFAMSRQAQLDYFAVPTTAFNGNAPTQRQALNDTRVLAALQLVPD